MTSTATVEDRTQFIGGSEIAAILGEDPYTTALQVYERKVGLATEFEGNFHTRRGTRLEEVAAEEYAAKHGVKLHRVNARIVHKKYPFITARIDRRIVGQRKLTEFKVPFLGSFGKIKREGLHEGYIVQMQTYLGLTDYEEGDWGIFNADLWELLDFSIGADAKLYTLIEEAAVNFWTNHVEKRVPPPAVEADEERIEIKRIEGELQTYEVTDPVLTEAIVDLRDARRIKKDAESLEDDAKARIVELAGEGKYGLYKAPGVNLTWGQQSRASFDKKALAGAKPLDRLAVGAVIQPYFNTMPREYEAMVADIGKAALDLTAFEKQGKPFDVFRVAEPK